jgi:hypothetical protein
LLIFASLYRLILIIFFKIISLLDLPINISNSPGSNFQSLETLSQKAKALSVSLNSIVFFSPFLRCIFLKAFNSFIGRSTEDFKSLT